MDGRKVEQKVKHMNRRTLRGAWLRTAAAVLLALSLCQIPAFAAAADNHAGKLLARDHAEKLTALHLLRGVGVTEEGEILYALEETPTRLQGLIMLVRLLGAEDEAVNLGNVTPFLDLSGGSAGYVSYAYRGGITKGTSDTTFTPGLPLTARTYITFLLRALGYSEQDGDFRWGEQVYFAASLGMMTRRCAQALEFSTLTRGEMVDLSYAALSCLMKGRKQTLAQKLRQDGVFTLEEALAAGVLGEGSTWTMDLPAGEDGQDGQAAAQEEAITYDRKALVSGDEEVAAHIFRVDTKNPRVKVKAALVDGTLGHTASFFQIVQSSGNAALVMNANFFSVNNIFKTPLGNLMADGEFLYAGSGLSSLAVGKEGGLQIGRPVITARLDSAGETWSVSEINTTEQHDDASILYTPAYGERVHIQNGAWTLVVEDGLIAEFYSVTAGASVTIPAGGFVAYMGFGYAQSPDFRFPQKGEEIQIHYEPREEAEGSPRAEADFTLEGVESIISGAPRLVREGKMETMLEEKFSGSRFTTLRTPRSAAGIDRSGKLVLVCVPDGATIGEMRRLMLDLDCVDALNLDGGASCALYYRGASLAVPTRELTCTLQVFVEE